MPNYVAIAALIMSGVSFVVYLALGLIGARAKLGADGHADTALAKAQTESLGEVTDLVKALPGLFDSLNRAGPALTSIVASVLFLAIAAYAGAPTGGNAAPGGKTGDTPKTEQPAAPPHH